MYAAFVRVLASRDEFLPFLCKFWILIRCFSMHLPTSVFIISNMAFIEVCAGKINENSLKTLKLIMIHFTVGSHAE